MDKIFLAPRSMHKTLLLNSRKDGVFSNPKILTKEEFLDKYYGRVTEVGGYYLFKKYDILYGNLMQLLPIIPRTNISCSSEKNMYLYGLKNELEMNKLIQRDEFFDQFIKGKQFEIYGYSNDDVELTSLLNTYAIDYKFVDFSKGNNKLFIKKYPILEDEIFAVLNEIAELLDNGVKAEDIYIYVSNESAIRYLKRYHESFGFQINFPNDQSLYSQEVVSGFLYVARQEESFEDAFGLLDLANIEYNEEIMELLVNLCAIDLEFDKKYDYISSYLKSRMLQNKRYENAINIIDSPIFEENKHIFIPCFAQNIFPLSYKDTGYISDVDKKELGILTSLEKCRIEDKISKDFLLSNNHFHLSRCNASYSERFFESPFVNSLGIEEILVSDLPTNIYSKKYGEYRLGLDLDKKRYFLEESKELKSLSKQIDIKYRKYDNSYENAEAVSPTDKLSFSYTSINEFFSCPFAYYLDNFLGISSFEENFYTKFGTVAHAVFQHQHEDGFSFEKTFEEARAKKEWTSEESLLLDRLKQDILAASKAAIVHANTYAVNPEIKTEYRLEYELDEYTKLTGVIDKIMILDKKDAILIDYKTGSDTFDKNKIADGQSMQLPTYAILFSNCEEFKDYNITGLYINNVVNSKFTSEMKDDEIVDSYLKLNGISLGVIDSINRIDSSILNGSKKPFFLSGVSLLNDGVSFKKTNSIFVGNELEEMKSLVLEKYYEANEHIRKNEFPIYPIYYGSSENACKYCEHRDICFVKKAQRHLKSKKDGEDD